MSSSGHNRYMSCPLDSEDCPHTVINTLLTPLNFYGPLDGFSMSGLQSQYNEIGYMRLGGNGMG